MHEPWDENYSRGYQWWLMTEAKKVGHLRCLMLCLYMLPVKNASFCQLVQLTK